MPRMTVDLRVLRDALFDRSLSQAGDSLLQTRVTEPFTIGEVPLNPSTMLSVRVLNRPEDDDDDGVFGAPTTSHISFDLQSAWVKYKLSAKLEPAARIPLLSLKGEGEVSFADYRIHRATDRAFAAMTDDLDSPRSLLSLDDVRKLAPGEAVTMEVGGSLAASVTLAWQDILGSRLTALFSDLPERFPIALRIKSGLSSTAALRVTDQFTVVISRTADRHFRIAVKKAKSRDHTFGISLQAGVEASAVAAIEAALAPAFAALTEAAKGRAPVLHQIAKLKAEAGAKLDALFRWKAMAGFAYEYARIDETTAIADYILLDDGQLADDHARVIAGKWDEIAASLRTNPAARAIVRYLNETTLTRRSSTGFSLGIGKWVAVRAKDQTSFSQSTRTSLDGFRLITCRGARRYEEKNIPQNDFQWVVDLKAQMTDFLEAPTSLDFDYGLQLAATLERTVISESDVDRILDFAAMWDVCVPDMSTFADAVGHKGTLRVQLLFEREQLAATLASMSGLAEWAEPLAAAMPYMKNFPERRHYTSRAAIYTRAWQQWLAGASLSNGEWSAMLRPAIHGGLILLEDRALPASFAWTVGDGHPQLRARLTSFIRGAEALHRVMTSAQPPEAIGEAYAMLEPFWSQRLYVAACGRALVARAREAGVTPDVTLQIEFADQTITS